MEAAEIVAQKTVYYSIFAETHAHAAEREALLDRAMGLKWKKKSSQKLRRGRRPSEGLAFVAHDASSGAIVGTVRLWDVSAGPNGPAALLLGPLAVDPSLKSAGIGKASESTTRTPAGVFGLTEAFGILPDNGTRLPYRQVDTSDWWVSDVGSAAYNTHFRCAPGPNSQ